MDIAVEHTSGGIVPVKVDMAMAAVSPLYVWEADLIRRLGVNKQAVVWRRARKSEPYVEGKDWGRVRNRVRWTEAAAQRLAKEFGLKEEAEVVEVTAVESECGKEAEKVVVKQALSEWPVEGVVRRVNIPNPTVVEVAVDGKRGWLMVRPEWRAWFGVGMKLGMRAVREVAGEWRYVTRKPRMKGKW